MQLTMLSMAIFALTLWGERRFGEGEDPEAPPDAEAPAPPPTERDPKTLSPGAKIPIPPPVVTRAAPAEAPDEAAGEAAIAEGADGSPGEAAEPLEGEALRGAIQAAAREALPAVKDCLTAWWMLDPALAGEVVMELTLTPEGLGEGSILNHSDVPVGPLSCFGAALYEGDWPAVEGETVVTYPFAFDPGP